MEPSCLNDTILQELAAGIAPEETLDQHFEHIAQCARCGSRFKLYLAEFSDEITPEEQAFLSTLESSTPEGQKAIVQKLLRWKTHPERDN